MAVSPPFDALTALPGLAISKIPPLLGRVKTQLTKLANEVVSDCIKLPEGVSCDDPRVTDIKKKLDNILDLIDKLREILKILNVIVTALRIGISIGSTIKNLLLVVPLPTPPAANEAVQVQNEFLANAKNALKQISLILTVFSAAIEATSMLLTQGLQILSQICVDSDDVFTVNQQLKDAIDLEILKELDLDSDIVSKYGDNITTEWHSKLNTSKEDNTDRLIKVDDLVNQQRSLMENLIEAPSRTIVNNDNNKSGKPADTIGLRGDYYVDNTQNKIYGPKISDSEWPRAINY
jgi:hypothetical protein